MRCWILRLELAAVWPGTTGWVGLELQGSGQVPGRTRRWDRLGMGDLLRGACATCCPA